jgi:hypothetical protein
VSIVYILPNGKPPTSQEIATNKAVVMRGSIYDLVMEWYAARGGIPSKES